MSNDNTKSNEYSQKILEAMDIIAQSKINSISFDKTITCTITNDEKRKEGEYEVSDGSTKFKAYSQDNGYRKDDVVYITIPEGNYNNQKIILGKKTDDTIKPFVFQLPFDTLFDMTGNMIAKKPSGMLLANDVEYNEETLEVSDITPRATEILIDTLTDINQSNYTRLGIKADFKTWISEAIQGSYGLRLKITTEAPNTVPDKEGKQENGETTTITHILTFNVNDMYGNPYNYETFYNQEKVFNISEFDKITKIEIYFYQNGDFYNKQSNLISAVDAFQNRLWENLYVDNLYLCLGYDINTLTDDYVEIFTQDSSDYARSTVATDTAENVNDKNKKTIQMRWVHINDDGTPIDMSKSDNTNYQVRWYRYHIGAAAADSYSGVYWEESDAISSLGISCEFIPDINNQQEKIKAIVLYNYNEEEETGIPYYSNEIIFENQETLPPGQTAQHIASALNIVVDDGSNGNYLIYGQDNSIKDTSYGDEIRKLLAEFDANNDGEYESDIFIENLNENNYLVWEFPTLNTMIEIINDEIDEEGKHTGKIKNDWPQYKISKYYSPSKTNNTITCQYVLNGVIYNSEIEFTFGHAGTMGTDQTLVIDFIGDTNAINLDSDKNIYEMTVRVYDKENKELLNVTDNIYWSWYYPDVDDNATANKITINNRDKQICNLSFITKPSHGELYIIKVKVGDLETYHPIALKSGDASYIEGPTQIIYMSDGTINYQNVPYKVFKVDKEELNVEWSIINEGAYTGSLDNNKLKPLGIYVKNAPVYGVQCGYWTQPILVLQNRWPNGVVNAWDGKSLQLNEEDSTILANAIAAGEKDSQNRFSGVMLGTWKGKDVAGDIKDQTGVYGFHQGAMSYAFKEDGTAFIGKSGMGRIEFDGSKGIIQSASWTNNSYPKMQIDLDDTKIEMFGSSSDYIKLNVKETGYPIQLSGSLRIDLDNNQTGYIGELTANEGGVPDAQQAKGFGLRLLQGSNTEIGGFKATSGNTGLYYVDGGYLSISKTYGLSMGSTNLNLYASNSLKETSSKISLDSNHVGMWVDGTGYITFGENNQGENECIIQLDDSKIIADDSHLGMWLDGVGWISWFKSQFLGTGIGTHPSLVIEGNSNKTTYIKIANIPAENQYGIYARFA